MAASSYSTTVCMRGGTRVFNDQIDTALTFTPGQAIYIDANAKMTNVQATSEKAIGLSMSAASSSAPTLDLLLF